MTALPLGSYFGHKTHLSNTHRRTLKTQGLFLMCVGGHTDAQRPFGEVSERERDFDRDRERTLLKDLLWGGPWVQWLWVSGLSFYG